MAKHDLHEKALALRREGQSYSAIRAKLGVSKSTLTRWIGHLPLSKERIGELRDHNEQRIERYRETRKRNKDQLLLDIYNELSIEISEISQRELFIAGFFLYWGEGGKTQEATPCIANTDPSIIIAFMKWLEDCFGVRRSAMRARIHLYRDMDVESELNFWSQTIGIPRSQFMNPYMKESSQVNLSYKNGVGHGTCNLLVNDVTVGRRILAGVRVLKEYFGRVAQW